MAQKEIVWHISDAMYNEMTQAQRELSFLSLMDLLTLAVQRYLAEVQHMKNGSSNSGSCSRMSKLPTAAALLPKRELPDRLDVSLQ